MKLTILTDNMTKIDAYYLGEPGVSYYLECDGKKILFDTGYSNVFISNAGKMGLDMKSIDAIVISHGHNDHTGGLREFPAITENIPVYAHPEAFEQRIFEGINVGCPLSKEEMKTRYQLKLSSDPVYLTEHLVFLGGIPRVNDYESKEPIGERNSLGMWKPDFLPDDSALVYKGKEGLTIITGCSHSGICNITEYAKTVCNDDRIYGIIGGFHLMQMSPRVEKTIEYLKAQEPRLLCPSHCTCFSARAAINNVIPVTEVCVGDVFEID